MSEINVGEVAMVNLCDIEVGERARHEMGNIDELECNMKEIGMISPLAVKRTDSGKYYLLAGERRIIALRKNNVSTVPVRVYPANLSQLEIKTIEMAENFYRKDMEYHEYDKLVLEIHQMQQELKGIKTPGPTQTGWSVEDTGEMLGGISKGTVSTAIKRAEAREAFPQLFESCKTASDATKILKKMDEAIIKQVIAQRLESQTTNGSLKRLADSFIINDFFTGVKKIPDGIMHLVEIDPPYAIDLTEQKKKDGESSYILTDYNEINKDDYPTFIGKVLTECYRVMTEHSWLILWFAPEPWFDTMYKIINSVGFETTRMCGVWTKGTSGQSMNPTIRLANSYEMFFYCWKGQPALNKAGRSNDFHFSPVPPNQKTHPTERPIELMYELYDTFAFTGSRILIPFLGSGNGLLAAHQLNMSAIGFELSKAYRDSFLVKVHGMKTV